MSRRIAIIGAGNGGSAAAADLTRAGYEVSLYNRTDARLEPFRRQGGIHLRDPDDRGVVPIARLTSDIAEALGAADLVAVMLPTSTLELYAELMAPRLRETHRVLLMPGHTGGALNFRQAVARLRPDLSFLLGETHTLPYICRFTGDGEVTLWKRAEQLMISALPATDSQELLGSFADAFPVLRPVSSVLETSLNNLNAVMHAPGMLLNAGWIEHTRGGFRYYSEGNTAAVGRVIQRIDDERRAIGRAFGLDLISFLDAFYQARYTTEEAWRSGDVSRAILNSPPNREIKSPESLDHRYIHEDIGYGLVPMLALAQAVGVATLAMAALVLLVNTATGIDYHQVGLNGTRLGIEGMTGQQLLDYVAR
jgi:opine dehydrogenase